MRPTIILSLAAVTAMLALSGQPHELPAAPTNITPPNPAGNEAALRAEIERLTSELAAAQAKSEVPTVAPVASPAPVPVVMDRAAGPRCAGGSCAVPRARVQAASEGRRWQQQSRRLLPWRR